MASVRHRNGKWQVRVKRGSIVAEKTFLTKQDAERWGRRTEVQIERGEYLPPLPEAQTQTLSELIDQYKVAVASRHRSATTKFNLDRINKDLGSTGINQLTPKLIAEWRDQRLRMVKASTVLREINTLSAVLNVAIREWGSPIVNPVPSIKKPSSSQGRTRRLDSNEEEKLLEQLAPHYRRVVEFALATGMRRGEILSLKWRDVDFKKRTAFLPITKNGESRRVPLSSKALSLLNEQANATSQADSKDAEHVFPVHYIALDKAWVRARTNAGVSDLHFHDLRHEAISRFFELGLNMMEVASISGHKSLQMLKRYTHPKAEEIASKLG